MEPVLSQTRMIQHLEGDCRQILLTLPARSVHGAVTSPPYWGLRSNLPSDHPALSLSLPVSLHAARAMHVHGEISADGWQSIIAQEVGW